MPDLSPGGPHTRVFDRANPPGFGIDVAFGRGETVVAVRGDVDRVSAPVLRTLLHALIEQDRPGPFALDLADLSFLNSAGLSVIADAASDLAEQEQHLVVRSASLGTQRMLEATGVVDLVSVEAGPFPLPVELSRRLGRQAHDEVLEAALLLVTTLAAHTLDGAQGVSISLRRARKMSTVAATDEKIVRMDDHQYETGEGPCLSAADEGVPVLVESLRDEDRWPAFVPRALEEGITSILSSPLLVTGRAVGALNVYSDTPGAFGVPQQELAALFAAEASGLLAGAAAFDRAGEEFAVRLREALTTRDLISRAHGVLMAHRGFTALDAANHLHRAARTSGISVAAEASAVLNAAQSTQSPLQEEVHDA